MIYFRLTLVSIGLALLSACARQEPQAPAMDPPASVTRPQSTSPDTSIDNAIASRDRLAGDREEDTWRKPKDLLLFLGAKRGMRIIDVFAGAGYYTELLSHVVGPDGAVIAYNNVPYAKYAGEKLAQRYANNRLPNVQHIEGDIDGLKLDPGTLDAAIFIMSYHDLYWRPDNGSWPPTDPAALVKKIFDALKPGGVVLVEDHVANPAGDTAAVVNKLHRIDPEVVKRDFTQAGFKFDGESDVLRRPEDNHTKLVFDESIRHRTDQFIFRFRKPG
jgi:predicted methyltransferase